MSVVEPALYQLDNGVSLWHADFLKLDKILTESIDLIVTSPPYNLGINYETFEDSQSYSDYLNFSKLWLEKCFSLAKPTGRLCLNIPLDTNKGGQQSIYADLTTIAKDLGWQYHSTIIWNKSNISRRTAWGSWLSASAPYVIAPVEVVVVLYKQRWKKYRSISENLNDISREEFLAWTNGLWSFNGEHKTRVGHPAPFPRELPRRCIKLFSYVGDVVLDPFCGSGTTLIEASLNKRIGIGVEISKNYCFLTEKRYKEACNCSILSI